MHAALPPGASRTLATSYGRARAVSGKQHHTPTNSQTSSKAEETLATEGMPSDPRGEAKATTMFAPMRKGQQQEEEGATYDDAEHAAVAERRRGRSAGYSATSRAALGGGMVMPMSAHGAHYSARVPRPMSATKAARVAAQTARREAEARARREHERAERDKARQKALKAAQRRQAEEERERERRQAERAALRAAQEFGEERERVAAEVRERANVPLLNVGPAAPNEKAARRRRLKNRPEWGEGHAGGHKLRLRQSPFSAQHTMTGNEWSTAMALVKLGRPPKPYEELSAEGRRARLHAR